MSDIAKSASSKTKTDASVKGMPRTTKSTSKTPSTSSISYKISKPPAVLSISSSFSDRSDVHHSNRKRHASPDQNYTAVGDFLVSESSKPRKKRKMEVLPASPSDDRTRTSYDVTHHDKIAPQDEDNDADSSHSISVSSSKKAIKGKGKQAAIPEDHARLNGDKTLSTNTHLADLTSTKNKSAVSSSKFTPHLDLTQSIRTPQGNSNGKSLQLTPNIRLLLRREEEESTQEATSTVPQQASGSIPLYVPHIDLLRRKPSKHKSHQPPNEDTVNVQAPTEDISIDPSDYANVTSADLGFGDDYVDYLPQDLSYAHEKPLELDEYQPDLPHTPPKRIHRYDNAGSSDNTGSVIKSRMKGNRSVLRDRLSPTRSRHGSGDHSNESRSIHASDKADSKEDKPGLKVKTTKVLCSLPVITPSRFAPYLVQSETPMSSIEDFSPDNARKAHGKISITETEDIVQEDDSLTDDVLRQRGLELADQAATVRKRERKGAVSVRRPLNAAAKAAKNTDDIPPSTGLDPQAVDLEPHSAENDLSQEMEDTYVDLSGGYAEEDVANHGNGADVGILIARSTIF
jgi:hypothetical protein